MRQHAAQPLALRHIIRPQYVNPCQQNGPSGPLALARLGKALLFHDHGQYRSCKAPDPRDSPEDRLTPVGHRLCFPAPQWLQARGQELALQPTHTDHPDYFHKVVDCQWACPAHTPVPEYIRLIAAGRYGDAYMVNWDSNVFPGILGRTCDRPCEPACRRGRVEDENSPRPEPVAICRLKRVAADLKEDISSRLPKQGKAN